MSEYCKNCYELTEKLQAKEQECEKLKIQLMQKSEVDTFFNTPIEGWDNDSCKICEYKQNYQAKGQECEKLKTQILLLQTMEIEELKNYKQSLDEIKEIMKKYCRKCKKHKFYHFKLCYTCKYTDILQKISECEVKNEN